MARHRALAVALGVVALAIHVTSVWMSLDLGTTFWTQAIPNATGVAIGLAGVLRGASSRLAWLVLLAFFGITCSELLVVSEWLASNGHGTAAAWWVVIVGTTADGFGLLMFPAMFPVMMLALLYPTGRLPSPRWRAYPVVLGSVLIAGSVAALVTAPVAGGVGLTHPLFGDSAPRAAVDVQFQLFFVASLLFLLSLGALVGRFRRSDLVVRQQIKWFGFGVAIYAVFNLVMFVVTESGTTPDGANLAPIVSQQLSILLDSIVFSVIPMALGFAVFRFRLFDVDRLISRTVGYAIVFGVVAIVFAVIVAVPAVLLSRGDVESWEVALATLGAAALFDPIRARVQRVVDRRFDRARFDAAVVIDLLGARIQETVDVDEVRAATSHAVDRILRPSSIGVWLNERRVG